MYDPLKGFRDFYPREMAARREVIEAIEAAAQRRGFREIGTPRLERAAMWTDKSDEDIVDELYAFEDKGGRHVTLAPELTPTVARMVAARGQELAKPIKWYSTRPFWRYEQVQQGRFREFYQTNIDIFGSDAPEADAEILAVAGEFLTDLGVPSAEFEFRVSHRDVLEALLRSFGDAVDVRPAIRAIDKSEKLDTTEYYALLREAGLPDSEVEEFDSLLGIEDVGNLDELLAFTEGRNPAQQENLTAAIDELRAVWAAAEDFGLADHCNLSLRTARGLDYYTGVVFECFDAKGRIGRSIFGGGRYDDLVETFGGPSTPAVGVAPGVMNSTLPLLLQETGAFPAEELRTDYYVLGVGDTRSTAARIAADLRARDHIVETDVADRSFTGQLEYADKINAETVVIVGERDLEDGNVTVKQMSSGDQTTAPVDEFPGTHDRPTYDDFV